MFEGLRHRIAKWAVRGDAWSIGDPYLSQLLGGQGPTGAGVDVGKDSALASTPIFGCIKIIAETVSQLPLHLCRRLPAGGGELATDHPLYDLLAIAPNEWTTTSELRMRMQAQACLTGNAYAYVNRDPTSGDVSEIVQLPATAVQVEVNPRTQEPVYRFQPSNGAESIAYSRGDIVHISGFGTGTHKGDSPIQRGREAIALSIVLERHAAKLFAKGARPAGLYSVDQYLKEDQRKRWNEILKEIGGSEGSGGTMLLEGGGKFTPLTFSSVDAQFLELRKFQLQEISRLFRIPPHMLGDLERTTHTNAETMGQQFLTFCLMPILTTWTDSLRLTLLRPEERSQLYFEFSIDDLAKADMQARWEAYSKALNSGILNPNEVRAKENRPPYEGGDVFMRSLATGSVTDGAEQVTGSAAPDDGAA